VPHHSFSIICKPLFYHHVALEWYWHDDCIARAMLIKPPTHTIPADLGSGTTPDPRQEIVDYFQKHPSATDSLEGIVNWWLPRQRYETARGVIQQALDDLVKQGILNEFVSGKIRLYRLSSSKSGS
jgi:hypothetical protein